MGSATIIVVIVFAFWLLVVIYLNCMATQTITEFKKLISVPLTIEQLAFSLSQLSRKDLEIFEELLDKKFQKVILNRGNKTVSQIKKNQTISLKELQKDFGE